MTAAAILLLGAANALCLAFVVLAVDAAIGLRQPEPAGFGVILPGGRL